MLVFLCVFLPRDEGQCWVSSFLSLIWCSCCSALGFGAQQAAEEPGLLSSLLLVAGIQNSEVTLTQIKNVYFCSFSSLENSAGAICEHVEK